MMDAPQVVIVVIVKNNNTYTENAFFGKFKISINLIMLWIQF